MFTGLLAPTVSLLIGYLVVYAFSALRTELTDTGSPVAGQLQR